MVQLNIFRTQMAGDKFQLKLFAEGRIICYASAKSYHAFF